MDEKKARTSAPPPPPPQPPQAWPSSSTLYSLGLQSKAEVSGGPPGGVGMQPGQEWLVQGARWRSEGFDQSEGAAEALRQRQAEARRAMLHKR